jgi:hypothetical protein
MLNMVIIITHDRKICSLSAWIFFPTVTVHISSTNEDMLCHINKQLCDNIHLIRQHLTSYSFMILYGPLKSYKDCSTALLIFVCMSVYPKVSGLAAWSKNCKWYSCHWVQLYSYFVSQSSQFCRHNPLFRFSTSVYCCCYFVIDLVRKLLVTPSYEPSASRLQWIMAGSTFCLKFLGQVFSVFLFSL